MGAKSGGRQLHERAPTLDISRHITNILAVACSIVNLFEEAYLRINYDAEVFNFSRLPIHRLFSGMQFPIGNRRNPSCVDNAYN